MLIRVYFEGIKISSSKLGISKKIKLIREKWIRGWKTLLRMHWFFRDIKKSVVFKFLDRSNLCALSHFIVTQILWLHVRIGNVSFILIWACKGQAVKPEAIVQRTRALWIWRWFTSENFHICKKCSWLGVVSISKQSQFLLYWHKIWSHVFLE